LANPFVPPTLGAKAYYCPICGAYSAQYWGQVYSLYANQYQRMSEFAVSRCAHCSGRLFWSDDYILLPEVSTAPPANEDLSPEIQADYAEAASIAGRSARGAAALLRLALQKLCVQLGESGRDINGDIGELVRKGLDVRVQRALDTVRVIGNEAVHPGELDLKDDAETVGMLFVLLNSIANEMITQPRLKEELYGSLPGSKLRGIEVRDAKAIPPPKPTD
jgi:uncharacterized protein DUF4145